ncbi:MAG: M61 family metallopeptidase [Chitinophagales bacterium]
MAKLFYNVRMPEPHTHYFEIELLFENDDEFTAFEMNVWTPGSYMVREYSKNVDSLFAFDQQNKKLEIIKESKNTWQVHNNKKPIIIKYKVYAFEETVRTCFLDEDHAAIIPAGLFIYPSAYNGSATIEFHPYQGWNNISTSLPMAGSDKWIREAPNRDILIDSPIEIGNHISLTFEVAGVEHELAVYGDGNYDLEKIKADIIKIIGEEVKIFGHHPCIDDAFAYKKYVFILHNSNAGRGGLEHLNSTSLLFKRLNYIPENNYVEFISLVSHEYFHLWNVKRLRPASLGPFNYNGENYTTSLWIAEGFTNYYDDLILRRAGIISEKDYISIAEKNINEIENAPGNNIHPVAEASFDAWIKYYRQNENSNNAQVNYYTKGGILAMLLDILIIHNSNGRSSLDDVMQEAYQLFYRELNRGYTEKEFKSILEKYSNTDLTDFYTDHVFGTKPVNYKIYFGLIGLQIENSQTGTPEVDMGLIVNDKHVITQIRKLSAGESGKLNVNDEILAINGFRFTPTLLSTLTTSKQPGEVFNFIVNRNGLIRELAARLQITHKVNYKISVLETATDIHKGYYKKWLSIETN